MTASAPSSTALATSDASARVGRGALIIDSSIWVATMTGFAACLARLIARFCTSGTCSSGNSTPSAVICPGLDVAGPRVHTIFARRLMAGAPSPVA
jgi:hypothetical protein